MSNSEGMALIAAVAEELVNRLLRLDTETLHRLGDIGDKVIAVRLQTKYRSDQDEPLLFYCFPSESGLRIRLQADAEADVTIGGDIPVFTKLVLGENMPSGFAAGELQIAGDFDLGHRFKKILDQVEIDWEEELSHYVGDVMAHKLSLMFCDTRSWVRHARQTLMQDVAEYLQEETRDLPKQREVDAFIRGVDEIRSDTERMQQRIQRLKEL
ncbi:MAG: SCP2 sterol-binding domain-containing protein [Gammaproteobacteria bacterium]|nr:MAG: SCP2 sterol-binding domain-containing protein [Gammaproteobacteria bacterium]